MEVTFLGVILAGAVVFGLGVLLGMLIYRVLWHIDTAVLRSELEAIRIHNRALQDEIVRLQNSHAMLSEHLELVRLELRDYKNRALIRSGITGAHE